MIETNIKNLSIEKIMQEIKKEVKQISQKSNNIPHEELSRAIKDKLPKTKIQTPSKFYNFAKKIANFLQRKGFYSFVQFVKGKLNINKSNYIYTIGDFSKFYDEDFIDNAYKLILDRDADIEGKNYYLNLLRSGKYSKTEIITSLHFSKEGRGQNVIILGAKKRYIISLIYKTPILGYIAKLLLTLFTLPRLLKRINQYENYINTELVKYKTNQFVIDETIKTKLDNDVLIDVQKSIENQINSKADNDVLIDVQKSLENQINSKADKSELNDKVAHKDLELYLQTVSYAKEYMKISQQNMQILIDEAKKRLPKKVLTKKNVIDIVNEEKHKFDTFYVEFEDKFRGTREDIKERVKVYLPYVEKLPFKKEKIKALDVGCGRGEWIELLEEKGYDAKGIDLNRIMVAKSQELRLDVKEYDVIDYLKSLDDNTLSVITGFHIIEHLPFEILMQMYTESYRVLKTGGMVIFETPNPENVFVGTCNFYTDPTHINPIPPETSKFILEQVNFKKVIIERRNTQNIHYDDQNINHLFASSIDYAVIGYKS